MPVHYAMTKNYVAEGYYPKVVRNDVIPLEVMVRNIVAKTTLTEATVRGTLQALKEEVILNLANGNVVRLDDFVTFSLSLGSKVTFSSIQDIVTKDNVQLRINIRDDVSIVNQVFNLIEFHKDITVNKQPIVTVAFETNFETELYYVPFGIFRVRGSHLKFNKARSEEGVFLIQPNGIETRLSSYSTAGDKIIDTVVPDLGNDLTLVVRTRYSEDGDLREGMLAEKLNRILGFLFEGAIAVLSREGATGNATVRWSVSREGDGTLLSYHPNGDNEGAPVLITEKGEYTLLGENTSNSIVVKVSQVEYFKNHGFAGGNDSITLV